MQRPTVLKWEGESLEVPASEVLDLVDTIEQIVTFDELHRMIYTGNVKRAQVSRAYAAAINYAIQASGSRSSPVDSEQVRSKMYADGEAITSTVSTVYGLIAIVIPPEHLQKNIGEVDDEPGKEKAASDS